MDADVNVIDAVQHAFHLYDAMEPATEPSNDIGGNVNFDEEDSSPQRGAPETSGDEDLPGNYEFEVPNPANVPRSKSHAALKDSVTM
jgi:hypothetical protein